MGELCVWPRRMLLCLPRACRNFRRICLSVNISRGSNTKLCQIYRDRRSSDNKALAFKSLRRPDNGLPAPACDHPNSEWTFLCHYITDVSCKNKSNRLQCLDTLWKWKTCGMGDSPAHAAWLCPLTTTGWHQRMHMLDSASASVLHTCLSVCACLRRQQGPRWRSQLSDGWPQVARQTAAASHHSAALTLTFPSAYFYASAEYFPPLFPSQVSSLTCSSDLYTFNLSHHTHRLTHTQTHTPSHFIFHLIIQQHHLNFSQRSTKQATKPKPRSQEQQTERSICWQRHRQRAHTE